MHAEINLLNHILNSGDMATCLNADVDKSFSIFIDEWKWIKQYYEKYREVPPADEFFSKHRDIDRIATNATMDYYIEELQKYKAKRVLQEIIGNAAKQIDEPPLVLINKMANDLAKLGKETRMIKDIDLIANVESRYESLRDRVELRKAGRKILGIPTGFQKLDDMYGGLQKGDFWVIAGPTGSLKSFLALKIAANAWQEGYRVLYFSLEMSAEQVGYRLDTLLAQGQFRNSSLVHAQGPFIADQYKQWADTNYKDKQPFIVVSNEELDEVNDNTVRGKVDQWHPDLVVLDYHGLFDSVEGGNEVEKTKHLSKAFKRIAIHYQVPIIDITAVTQDKSSIGKRPAMLHELAWSKQLGYDSDLCLSLFWHDEILQCDAVKTRRSAQFRFFTEWDIDSGRVREVSRNIREEDYEDEEDELSL